MFHAAQHDLIREIGVFRILPAIRRTPRSLRRAANIWRLHDRSHQPRNFQTIDRLLTSIKASLPILRHGFPHRMIVDNLPCLLPGTALVLEYDVRYKLRHNGEVANGLLIVGEKS